LFYFFAAFIFLQVWFDMQQNKINAATILHVLAKLFQHILFLIHETAP